MGLPRLSSRSEAECGDQRRAYGMNGNPTYGPTYGSSSTLVRRLGAHENEEFQHHNQLLPFCEMPVIPINAPVYVIDKVAGFLKAVTLPRVKDQYRFDPDLFQSDVVLHGFLRGDIVIVQAMHEHDRCVDVHDVAHR